MRKKNDNGLKAIICLAVATLAIGGASIALSQMDNAGQGGSGKNGTELTVGPDTKVQSATLNADGTYTLVIKETGYVGEMTIEATYSADGKTLISYDVLSHTETDGIGSKVDEDAYKAVLANIQLPIAANGMDISGILGIEAEPTVSGELKDGTYTAQTTPSETGDYNYVTITVEGGKVTNVVWDEITGGASKAELAANGQYVMIEGNPTWKDQSESLGAYVVENQTTDGIMNETGYTDVVSGVSIYVGGFVDLANQAIAQASATVTLKDGTYTAQTTPSETGDYNYVTITVEGGKVTNVVWDEITGGASKAELSLNGQYVMKPVWATQSESLGAYVVENQTTTGIMNETGYTDVVSGVSIYVGGFVDLADQAIAMANGQDGTYTAKSTPSESGDYNYVTITVEGGKVTSVVWDEITGGVSKAELSLNGQYVMKPVWATQSESLGAYVVENQTTAGIMNETGYTDVVSGVSIYVGGFVDLANQAIAQASVTGEVPGVVKPQVDATTVEVVSGATFSSKAVIRAIDEGYAWLLEYLK